MSKIERPNDEDLKAISEKIHGYDGWTKQKALEALKDIEPLYDVQAARTEITDEDYERIYSILPQSDYTPPDVEDEWG